ncbi:hypothetical protein [Mycobacteroides abscessus]|uniref:hypothetical protein n=1 Tax=Mycobacteroides abscessus TaxID=36809 RepID=UPI000C25B157|nr:hypothetical protein [Mycobacteroides abscessus]
MSEFIERWKSGTLSTEELDAHYAHLLDEARDSISQSSALSEEERQAVSTKLGTLKEIVGRGSIGVLMQGLGIDADRTDRGYDDSMAAVSIVEDDEEYTRERQRQEARRQQVFATELAADVAATTTNSSGHADPALLAMTAQPQEPGQEPDADSSAEAEPTGFAPYEKQPIAPPTPPKVPAPAPGAGPALQYPSTGVADAGEFLNGSDDYDTGEDKPLPSYLRVPGQLLQKGWARFRALAWPVQAMAWLLVAVLLGVGLFGRGSTAEEEIPDQAGPAIILNPNGNQPVADDHLVELQPTGGVGSSCEIKGFEAARAFGKNKGDGWICRRGHGIDGEFMEVDFGHPVKVGGVRLRPCLYIDHAGGANECALHRMVTQVKILAPDGQPQPDPIRINDPGTAPVKKMFAQPFTATRLSLIVQATKRPENSAERPGTPDENDDVDKTFSMSGLEFLGWDDARR